MRAIVWLWLAGVVPAAAFQVPVPAPAERCVEEAWARNLALQTHTLDVAAARARLAEARGAWQPRVDLVARYSVADGGRTIDLPVGDLLNGAYATLNDYLRSQGRPAAFGAVDNQSIPLLRDREQETKLRVTQPLYRPEITHGIAAARAAAAGAEAELAAYRRELRLAVLTGYYGYAQAEAAVRILDSAADLTAEALRVNRVLLANDKITEDRVLRAEADDLEIRQQQADAVRTRNSARAYLNFLLNRPLATEIELPDAAEWQRAADALLAETAGSAALRTDGREELLTLKRGIEAAGSAESAAHARLRPTLAVAVDGGIQGTSYRTGGDAGFVQGSLVADWNLWDGRQDRQRVEQARIARRKLEVQLESVRQQLDLQLEQAGDGFTAAVAGYRAADRRADAAARAFDLVSHREREGVANQLDFVDARTGLTRAQLNRVISLQRLLVAAAELDRAAALSPLP